MESTWKIFTLEEVAKHRDERSAWIVLGKNVYDVTNYVAEHPGGDQKLLENCGTDATLMFNDIGHSDYAKEKLNEFKIGELEKKHLEEPETEVNRYIAPFLALGMYFFLTAFKSSQVS